MKKAGKTKGMAKWMETGQMRGSLKSQKGFRTTKVRGPFGNLARDEAERHKKGQMMQSHSPQLRSTLGETSLECPRSLNNPELLQLSHGTAATHCLVFCINSLENEDQRSKAGRSYVIFVFPEHGRVHDT